MEKLQHLASEAVLAGAKEDHPTASLIVGAIVLGVIVGALTWLYNR